MLERQNMRPQQPAGLPLSSLNNIPIMLQAKLHEHRGEPGSRVVLARGAPGRLRQKQGSGIKCKNVCHSVLHVVRSIPAVSTQCSGVTHICIQHINILHNTQNSRVIHKGVGFTVR